MNKIGLIYSFEAHKSSLVASMIKDSVNSSDLAVVDAENMTDEEFLSYDKLILGVPTWFDGELPNYWDEFIPALEEMDMAGKKVAMFGLGDQIGYPENFSDGLGLMAEVLEGQGAEIVGLTSTDGYHYESSKAVRDNQFLGLVLDFENQHKLNKDRVSNWVQKIKTEFIE